jgi:hypothetical protein
LLLLLLLRNKRTYSILLLSPWLTSCVSTRINLVWYVLGLCACPALHAGAEDAACLLYMLGAVSFTKLSHE